MKSNLVSIVKEKGLKSKKSARKSKGNRAIVGSMVDEKKLMSFIESLDDK